MIDIIRCVITTILIFILAGCAIDPGTTTQLTTGDTSRINLVSNVNKQLQQPKSKTEEQKTFHACLIERNYNGTQTLAKFITEDKPGTPSPSSITINSDKLSSYISALWQHSKQNKSTIIEIIELHRGQDKACFEQEIISFKDNNIQKNNKRTLTNYQQSRKILVGIYNYLASTVKNTDYSEIHEQLARDHIPVRILIPTT